jgi:hypothetical protein
MMDGDERSGLCLGGPKDGQFLSCKWSTLETYARTVALAALVAGEMVPASALEITTVRYRHVQFLHQGFWLLVEVLDRMPAADIILEQLVSGYRRPIGPVQ